MKFILWLYASHPNTMRWHWLEQMIQPIRAKYYGGGCGKLGCRPYMGTPNRGYWCYRCSQERSPAYEAWMTEEMKQFAR